VYAIISGTNLFNAPWRDVALQAFVQGFLTPVISFWLYGRAVSILGASNGSAFAALSPVMTTLLAIPILGEWPATSDWIAMLLISGGVYTASGGLFPAPTGRSRSGSLTAREQIIRVCWRQVFALTAFVLHHTLAIEKAEPHAKYHAGCSGRCADGRCCGKLSVDV
jgi:EamA-like transporter family